MRYWPLAWLLSTGCGPIQYFSVVAWQASRAVRRAEHAQAEGRAPYEYTSAVEYLHKARELGGRAHYLEAVEFGHRACDFARKAEEGALKVGPAPAEPAPRPPERAREPMLGPKP
jgi:hypothetical protein